MKGNVCSSTLPIFKNWIIGFYIIDFWELYTLDTAFFRYIFANISSLQLDFSFSWQCFLFSFIFNENSFYFFLQPCPHGMWALVPWLEIKLMPTPAVKAQILNHCTIRKASFFFFESFFFPFFSLIFISWRLITLQYCSGFCHRLTWISHGFTLFPMPIPPPASQSGLRLLR